MTNLSEQTSEEIREQLAIVERKEAIESECLNAVNAFEGLLRNIVKGDGGEEYNYKCRHVLEQALIKLVELSNA